jgi:UDP-glucose:(heptosyl)LPS alpha-1,3-glucosyltransferase
MIAGLPIALCYESVLPSRGGAETYIADLARRLAGDGHEVHLYACRWDVSALPDNLHFHRLPTPWGPRFIRPWRFAASCAKALSNAEPHVSIGFNKTWGQDVQYLLAGLHVASAEHNLRKHAQPVTRGLARGMKWLDLAHLSFTLLERRQYLEHHPLVIVNSGMVREHCRRYYSMDGDDIRVVPCAIDPGRFAQPDRPRRRQEFRQEWGIQPEDSVALFVAMNYRLKGLEPLLHAVALLPKRERFRLLVIGNPRTGSYQRLARRLGITDSVRFLGPRSDVHHCFFAADFLAHPTFYDPCSLVVLEALACGLPVITSRYNGAAELLNTPREGYIIRDPHDHRHLAWCMEQLLDPARRHACSQAARHKASQWTFDLHYRQMLEVLEEAAARKQAA